MEIKATLDRFENETAVLITKNKEIINCPKSLLPEGAAIGALFGFDIYNHKINAEKNNRLAKEILNEILHS